MTTSFQYDLVAKQQLFENCQRADHYFKTLKPFNKLLCGSAQLTPSKYKRKQTHWKCFKPEKQVCLWAPCEFPTYYFIEVSLLQGATTMNSPSTEILYQLAEYWRAVFQGCSSLWAEGIKSCEDVSCAFGSGCACASLAGGIRPRMCH